MSQSMISNMKKKPLVLLFALAFLGSSLSTPAFAAVKAGAKCKIVGQTKVKKGKEFICIAKGKKLVWSKGLKVVVKATPTPSSTPTPTPTPNPKVEPFVPWSTNFEINSLIKSAIDSTNEYAGVVRPDNSYEISTQNSVSESDRKWIAQMLDYTNGFFSKVEGRKLKIFLGNSHEWSKETVRNAGVWFGDPNGTYPCSDGTRDAYCAGYKNLVLIVFLNPSQTWDIGRRSTPAHEIFHTVQFSLLGYNLERIGPDHPQRVPRWFMEGTANYFGYYMVERLGFGTYENGRNSQVRFNSEYQNIKPLSTYDNFETNPYGIGQAATEYIIASVGFESLLNIFKFTGTEGTFSAGFKMATGIELTEFYSKFEDARSSMQIGS
jgi:hypothetical protein